MADLHYPYLCGGTFFFLLLNARYSRTTSSRDHVAGKKEEMADRYLMDKLVYAVTGNVSYNVNSTLRKDTSNYRECKTDGTVNIPFNNPATTSAYFMAIKNKNPEILNRMTEFVDTYINKAMDEWLVRALLEIIQADEIDDNIDFYITSDCKPTKKKDLFSLDNFELQPFLMGIMLFIMQYRTDNKSGLATLERLGTKPSSTKERKFTDTTLGTQYSKQITVTRLKPILATDTDEKMVDEETDNSECIEAEVVDDDMPSGAASDNIKGSAQQSLTIIHHQTNVVQNGEKSVSLVNNGNLTINL